MIPSATVLMEGEAFSKHGTTTHQSEFVALPTDIQLKLGPLAVVSSRTLAFKRSQATISILQVLNKQSSIQAFPMPVASRNLSGKILNKERL